MNSTTAKAKLQFKKLTEKAIIPSKATKYAAGYDLHSAIDITIPAKGKGLVKTNLAVAIPYGNYGRVAPRSGLAWKNFIDVGAGVIDCDYRGEDVDFLVKEGDRIAQFIIEKITETDIFEVDELDSTERGEGGFGSTGVN